MAQGFPSLAINCMQILFFFFCLCACVWQRGCECVCVFQKPSQREAVPLKQNWKKNAFGRPITVEWAKDQDLQLSYINPAESGCSEQFAWLSKASVFHTLARETRQRDFAEFWQDGTKSGAGGWLEPRIYFMETAHSRSWSLSVGKVSLLLAWIKKWGTLLPHKFAMTRCSATTLAGTTISLSSQGSY